MQLAVQIHSRPRPIGEVSEHDLAGIPSRLTAPRARPRRSDQSRCPEGIWSGEPAPRTRYTIRRNRPMREPPEPCRANCAAQGLVDAGPNRDRRYKIPASRTAEGAASPSGRSPMSSGRLRSNRLIGASNHQNHNTDRGAGGSPAGLLDHVLRPWQQGDGADTNAGECKAHRQAAPAIEPVGAETGIDRSNRDRRFRSRP